MYLQSYSITFQSIEVTHEEIFAILGGTIDSKQLVDSYIDEVFAQADDLVKLEGGYLITDDIEFFVKQKSINIQDVSFNLNHQIFHQLFASERVAIFVCTAGNAVYEKARLLMSNGDFLLGYIYDIFGSLVVEKAMDLLQQKLKEHVEKDNDKITNRYSPGYCGWDVSEQKKLFSLLPVDFCGISINESCLMHPVKSVSGIIGIGKNIEFREYSCSVCNSKNCIYRNLRNKMC